MLPHLLRFLHLIERRGAPTNGHACRALASQCTIAVNRHRPARIIMRRLSQAVIWMIVKVPTGHTRIRHPSSSVLAIGAPTNIAYKNRRLRLSIRLLRALTVSQPVSVSFTLHHTHYKWRVTASRMLRRVLTTSSVVPDVPVQQATYPPRTDSQFWTFLSGYPLLCDDSLLPDIGHVRLRDRLRQT